MKSVRGLVIAAVFLGMLVLLNYLGTAMLINSYYIHVLIMIGINIILVTSLNLINGYLGEFAIGHAGFMAVGAYVSSACTVLLHLPFYAAMPIAAAVAMLIGFLVAIPSFKTSGDYLAIITLGFNMIIISLIQNMDIIGGPRGLGGMPKATNLVVTGAAVLLTIVVLKNLINSNYGRVWIAIRENEIAAEMMGVDITKYKVIAFSIAAFFAGLAGALLAHYMQYIHPSGFTYVRTTDLLVMLYLGGVGSLSGSVLGVSLMTILLEGLRSLGVWRMVLSPLILVVIMLTRPSGLLGHREWRFSLKRKGAGMRGTAASR